MEYEQFKTNKVFKAPEKYTASISSSKLLTPFRHNGNAIGTRVISAGFPFFKNQQTQENFSQFKFNTSTFSDTSKVKDYYLNSEPTDPNNWFLLSDNHKIASTGN
jgi:hypothetical protein